MKDNKKNLITWFESSGLKFGDFISHKDIDSYSGIEYPSLTEISTQSDLRDAIKIYSLQRLAVVEALKDYALTNRNMLFMPVRGEGYRIAHPAEQTDLVAKSGMQQIRKGLRYIERGIDHIEVSLLTNAEREYRTSVQSRLKGLALMMGRKVDLLPDKK